MVRDRLILVVADDGRGISPQKSRDSAGLGTRIMQYRANAIGAQLTIENPDSGGTQVRCTLKIED
jgi:signal transduction histidine kinase